MFVWSLPCCRLVFRHTARSNFTATQLWAAPALPWATWDAQAWVISPILKRSQLRYCSLLSTWALARAVLCYCGTEVTTNIHLPPSCLKLWFSFCHPRKNLCWWIFIPFPKEIYSASTCFSWERCLNIVLILKVQTAEGTKNTRLEALQW